MPSLQSSPENSLFFAPHDMHLSSLRLNSLFRMDLEARASILSFPSRAYWYVLTTSMLLWYRGRWYYCASATVEGDQSDFIIDCAKFGWREGRYCFVWLGVCERTFLLGYFMNGMGEHRTLCCALISLAIFFPFSSTPLGECGSSLN